MVTNRTGNHLDVAEKVPKFAQTTGTVDVFDPHSDISGPLRGEHAHVQISINHEPNPLI